MKNATMTSDPAYENVPAEIPLALTLEQAAARLGVKASYFRTTMTRLNNTDQDLRAPQRPGERFRMYDVDKLDAWKKAGMPVPKAPLRTPQATPGARMVAATTTRRDGSWVVNLPDIGQGTQAESLPHAQRVAHVLGLTPKEIALNVAITLPEAASTKWQQAKEREREAKDLAAQVAGLKAETVHEWRG